MPTIVEPNTLPIVLYYMLIDDSSTFGRAGLPYPEPQPQY